jgi:hypothetical protein
VIISWALSRSTGAPYFGASEPASTSRLKVSGSSAPMAIGGATSRVAATGVGTPFGESTVTSASPMPSDVIVSSTS